MRTILRTFRLGDEREDFQTVLDTLYKGVLFRGTNLWILVFAILIASLGLNVNSTAVIIGAMLISPLMGPIMGAGFSLAINDVELLRKSAYNLTVATSVGLAASTLYFAITPLSEAHSEILARTSPTIYDVLIAFFGGLAGTLATTSKLKGNVIPGAAIATALMPPLCTAGYGLATWKPEYFLGAFYLYIINAVFISLATLVTARVLRYPFVSLPDKIIESKTRRIIWLITVLTLLPSIYTGYDIVQKNRFETRANEFIDREAELPNAVLYSRVVNPEKRTIELGYAGTDISDSIIGAMRRKLATYDIDTSGLTVKVGFSVKTHADVPQLDAAKESDITLGLKAAIHEKDLQLLRLRSQVDSLKAPDRMTAEIFRELRILYPDIVSLATHPVLIVQDSVHNHEFLCLIGSRQKISPEESDKIRDWLAHRLATDKVRLIIERVETPVATPAKGGKSK